MGRIGHLAEDYECSAIAAPICESATQHFNCVFPQVVISIYDIQQPPSGLLPIPNPPAARGAFSFGLRKKWAAFAKTGRALGKFSGKCKI